MVLDDAFATEGFRLGTPSLVCRWRLFGGKLPLENRHLRALAARTVGGKRLSQPLVAWAKQHIEWTLAEGASAHPDGVLMLVVDDAGQAAMTAGPYLPLGRTTYEAIMERASSAYGEACATGVAPEALWLVQHDALVWGIDRDFVASGASTLVADLAHTLGMRVEHAPHLVEAVRAGAMPFSEAFLVSDEHGVVPASDIGGTVATRFASSYEKLLAKTRR